MAGGNPEVRCYTTCRNCSTENIDAWLLDLEEYGFVSINTRGTHYAHAESAVGSLRRKAANRGLVIIAEVHGPFLASVRVGQEVTP